MKYLISAAVVLTLAACTTQPVRAAESANTLHFARQSDAYCGDLATTAQRAAEARDRGEKYSSLRAINGYRPTSAYPTDFDLAHDRKLVAKAAFDSHATPAKVRAAILQVCLPE